MTLPTEDVAALVARLASAIALGDATGARGKHPSNIYNLANEAATALSTYAHYELRRLKGVKANAPDWEKLWAEQSERADELENLICRIEPHIDAIVCYASTMGEHEPNRIAHEVRAITGRGARDAGPRYETWRDLDEARLATAIMAFFEPCEGSTIDGVRAAILAWEQSR